MSTSLAQDSIAPASLKLPLDQISWARKILLASLVVGRATKDK